LSVRMVMRNMFRQNVIVFVSWCRPSLDEKKVMADIRASFSKWDLNNDNVLDRSEGKRERERERQRDVICVC